MSSNPIDFAKLAEPFPECDIEWRVQEAGKGKAGIWCKALCYVTNRAIQERLDKVCGPANWKNEYFSGPAGGVLCRLSIRCGDEWVAKEDGADNTAIDPVKGGYSNAMKRAAVQWNIGRYLYRLDVYFVNVTEKRTENSYYARLPKDKGGDPYFWTPPTLPAWAVEGNYASPPDAQHAPESADEPPIEKPQEPSDVACGSASRFQSALVAVNSAATTAAVDRLAKVIRERVASGVFTANQATVLEGSIAARCAELNTPAENPLCVAARSLGCPDALLESIATIASTKADARKWLATKPWAGEVAA